MHGEPHTSRPASQSRHLLIFAAAVLITLAVAALPGVRTGRASAASSPVLDVSAADVQAGAAITVRGRAFPARRAGVLVWSGAETEGTAIATDPKGAFSATVAVPASPGGTSTLRAVMDELSVETVLRVQSAAGDAAVVSGSTSVSEPVSAAPVTAGGPATTAAALTPAHRVVGYFPIWLRNSGYTERDVDFSVVNTIAHFSVVPRADGSIEIPDWGPFPDPALVSAAHAGGAKVVLVVGGDHEAARDGFARLAAAPASRARFVSEVMALVTREGYDGIDLDWEFPETDADRSNLTLLARDLRAALGPARTLSLSGPSSDWYGRWYDFAALMPLLDWVGAMTYDINAPSWSPAAGHNAPLYAPRGEASVDASRAYYLGRGVPAEKLLIGLPFYGQRFDGASDLGQPFPSKAGAALGYQEVAGLLGSGEWQAKRDATARTPYLVKSTGGAIISYDDPDSITAKCRYVTEQGVGGVIIWHLGRDRVGNSQPLLQAVRDCR